jgi:hypothetical protein
VSRSLKEGDGYARAGPNFVVVIEGREGRAFPARLVMHANVARELSPLPSTRGVFVGFSEWLP